MNLSDLHILRCFSYSEYGCTGTNFSVPVESGISPEPEKISANILGRFAGTGTF